MPTLLDLSDELICRLFRGRILEARLASKRLQEVLRVAAPFRLQVRYHMDSKEDLARIACMRALLAKFPYAIIGMSASDKLSFTNPRATVVIVKGDLRPLIHSRLASNRLETDPVVFERTIATIRALTTQLVLPNHTAIEDLALCLYYVDKELRKEMVDAIEGPLRGLIGRFMEHPLPMPHVIAVVRLWMALARCGRHKDVHEVYNKLLVRAISEPPPTTGFIT